MMRRRRRWTLTDDHGIATVGRYCVMATGCLSIPNWPEIKGLESFAGPNYHTGLWPHEKIDFTGLRVGIIGTGSSAIQSIPVIVREAEHLYVFQRTPNYSVPRPQRAPRPGAGEVDESELCRDTGTGEEPVPGHRRRVQFPLGHRRHPRRAPGSLRTRLEAGRADVHLDLQRPIEEQGIERHGGGVRARQDPRHRQRPDGGRVAVPDQYHRRQASVRRHRILRDLQPGRHHPGRRPARSRSRRSPRVRSAPADGTTRSTHWSSPPASTR